jgi:hypothetical protein
MSDRPYSRLYWELLREFPELAGDCELAGAYSLLLIGADMAWDGTESRPFLPRHIADTVLARLVSMGLVFVTEPTYTIRGHTKERARRSHQASKASNARWNAASNAGSNAGSNADAYRPRDAAAPRVRMPRRVETSKDEQSKDDAAVHFYDLNGGQASPKALKWVEEMAQQYGDAAVIEAMAANAADGRVDLKATSSALALAGHQRAKAAEQRNKDAPIREAEEARRRAESATPEEVARAETRKAGIAAWIKGGAA